MATRRSVAWFDAELMGQTVASGGFQGHAIDLNMVDSDKRGCTVTRIIGTVTMRPVLLDLRQFMFLGICMVTSDAIAGNVFPDPNDAGDQPGWLYRTYRTVIMSDLQDHSQETELHFDIRAQRKYRGVDDNLLLIFTNEAGGGTSVNYDFLTRTLCRMG